MRTSGSTVKASAPYFLMALARKRIWQTSACHYGNDRPYRRTEARPIVRSPRQEAVEIVRLFEELRVRGFCPVKLQWASCFVLLCFTRWTRGGHHMADDDSTE